MSLIATSATRVPAHTAPAVNQRIRSATDASLAAIGHDPRAIRERLAELDREWDVERAIQSHAAVLALAGTVLGITTHRAFLAVPAVVTAFLLQHAVQGWCPPLPMLRRLGFRTLREIEAERQTLLLRLDADRTADPARA